MIQQKQMYPFSQAHFQLAIEAASVGVWDWDLMQQRMVWNEQHKKIFGVSMDAATNYTDFLACLHPDERERVHHTVQKSLETHQEYNIEYRVLWPDGSVRWVAARGRGIYNAQGNAVRMIGVVVDITPQKEAEERQRAADRRAQERLEAAHRRSKELNKQLVTKQAFLHALMEQVPAGLVIAEAPSENLIFCNEEALRLMGYIHLESDNYQRHVQPGITHLDGTPYKEGESPLMRTLRTGEIIKQEMVRYRRPDGAESYFSVNVAPVRDEQGQMIAVVCAMHDFSEYYELERKKDEFISIVSHELRTPLTAMSGNLQMAERRLKRLLAEEQIWISKERRTQAEDIATSMARALSQVKVQSRMIDDLLDATRIQTRKMHLAMERCDLCKIVAEVVCNVRAVLPGRTILLEVPDLGEIAVVVDAMRIGQVVHNFLTNALKYSPEAEPITVSISLEERAREVRVWVRDAGPGLSQEEQQRIWDRFYQTPGGKGEKGVDGGGLGLGLYISHALVHEHSGQIGVQSAPGQGSVFWFSLPLAPS